MKLILGMIFAVILVVAGSAGKRAYDRYEKSQKAAQQMASMRSDTLDLDDFLKRWDDAFNLAQSTPRVALAAQIARLQEMGNYLRVKRYSGCMEPVRKLYLEQMDSQLGDLTSFLASTSSYGFSNETGDKMMASARAYGLCKKQVQ